MLDEMSQDMGDEGSDVQAKLQVLQEIKNLMDSRLGDSLKPKEVSIDSVSLKSPEASEEAMESPEFQAGEEEGMKEMGKDDSGISDEDKEKLKMMYSGLKG